MDYCQQATSELDDPDTNCEGAPATATEHDNERAYGINYHGKPHRPACEELSYPGGVKEMDKRSSKCEVGARQGLTIEAYVIAKADDLQR